MRAIRRVSGGQWRKWGLALLLVFLAAQARALPPPPEEPQWLRLQLTDCYLSLDAEGEADTFTSANGGLPMQNRRYYVAPAIGVGLAGSIYHSDLFGFMLKAEPGYIWEETGPPNQMATMNSYLQSYDFSGSLLKLKPYATTIFANASHDIHSYDFFNTAIMDQQTYGFLTGYREGPVPVTLSFQRTHQDINGLSADSTLDQTSLNLHAHNDRANGNATDFTYLFGQFDQTTGSGQEEARSTGDYNYVTLTDAEHLGDNSLNSTLLFNHVTTDDLPSDDLTLTFDLTMLHTENLRSAYEYSFTYYDDDFSEATQNFLQAGIRHQLFESLTSGLNIHGTDLRNNSDGTSLHLNDIGVQGSVNYTKRLGDWGRLSLGNWASYDYTVQTSSGSALSVFQESHTVTASTAIFRLNQPRNTAIFTVTADASHGELVLQPNVDYTVDDNVDPYQITINFGSLTVQTLENNGSVTVLVSYEVVPNPSGSYSTIEDQFSARLDLFHRTIGLYSLYQTIENNTSTRGFVLDDIHELQAGADFSWRGLKLDANYLDLHSSLYSYSARTLTEDYTFRLDSEITGGIDLRQQWSDFPDQHASATYYDFLAHLEWHPTVHFGWSAEGGLQRQRGLGLDQDLYAARTHIDWQIGKISLHLGYEYQNQNFEGELRQRNFGYLRLRRSF